MGNLVKKNDTVLAINIQKVKDKIAVIRNLEVIADADVAELYGVETKRINETVKNNPDKFPKTYHPGQGLMIDPIDTGAPRFGRILLKSQPIRLALFR